MCLRWSSSIQRYPFGICRFEILVVMRDSIRSSGLLSIESSIIQFYI